MNCPNCGLPFQSTNNEIINAHIDQCLSNYTASPTSSFKKFLYNSEENIQFQLVWILIKNEKNKNVWTQVKRDFFTNEQINEIINYSPQEIITKDFQQKQIWFKFNLETLRVMWTQGADPIMITKNNIIDDTLNFINLCDLHKEIKIYIENDVVQDAGGLFREWISMILNEIIKKENNLFTKANIDESTFKINQESIIDEKSAIRYNLFGKIIGKAIFERIPINVYIDQCLIKHLLNKKIDLEDIKFYDKDIYRSLTYLLNTNLDKEECFEEYFTTVNSQTKEIVELKTNGKDIKLCDANKKEYVDLLIEYITLNSIKTKISPILAGFYEVIPLEFVEILTVDEFQIILNGLPFIDVKDWKENTIYKGIFNKDNDQIGWFWTILEGFSQDELSKILKYCTGSNRVSPEGFKNLESNRGKFCKFCIESGEFDSKNPFPKGMTCFNKLILPTYKSKEEMKTYLQIISQNEFDGIFGLE